MSIEDIAALVPPYPDGGRPRARTVARRLSSILALVSRGPNGSRGNGARYLILAPGARTEEVARNNVPDVEIGSDRDWLLAQVERMTGGK